MPIEPITAAAAVALLVPISPRWERRRRGSSAKRRRMQPARCSAGCAPSWLGGRGRRSTTWRKRLRAKQLAKALEADPALAEELRALIPPEAMKAGAMVQNASGAGAKAAQVQGSRNTTTIS